MVVDVGGEDVAEVVARRAEAAISERDGALAIVDSALSTTTTSLSTHSRESLPSMPRGFLVRRAFGSQIRAAGCKFGPLKSDVHVFGDLPHCISLHRGRNVCQVKVCRH